MKFIINTFFILFIVPFLSCRNAETKTVAWAPPNGKEFSDYWYQGKAELTNYDLEQARYGEVHKGNAVLIYVTEDFWTAKQVKLEDYSKGKAGAAPVLKLNFTKNFTTGIYPYTMMKSVFTPIDLKNFPHSLKITSTVLEWCGQVFTQINHRKDGFNIRVFSYFEKEADTDYVLKKDFLEDEIWSRIRIAPELLPVGKINIIPGTMTSRLRHKKLAVETALATIQLNADTMTYTVNYSNDDRILAIQFNKDFPHEILSWAETYKDGFGESASILITKAVRKKSTMLDYWNKHAVADSVYRKELGLN
ncbi:septum formation inhibitor Maf [bacterium]|nr:septum formation inhibitor Maf [bacterium]